MTDLYIQQVADQEREAAFAFLHTKVELTRLELGLPSQYDEFAHTMEAVLPVMGRIFEALGYATTAAVLAFRNTLVSSLSDALRHTDDGPIFEAVVSELGLPPQF